MKIFILGLLSTLLLLVLYSNVIVRLGFIRHNEDDCIIMDIATIYGILGYTKKISFVDLVKGYKDTVALEIDTRKKGSSRDEYITHYKSIINMDEMVRIFNRYKNLYVKYGMALDYIKRKTVITSVLWHTEIGTGDAAQTAIITGIIWSIKSSLIALMTKDYDLSNLSIKVVPNYNVDILKTNLDCIFSIRLGYIIIVRMKILLAQIKDGVKNGWSSDRVFDEDYNGKY